jgi:hypothetical protein
MSSQKVHYDACLLGHAKLETTALYTRGERQNSLKLRRMLQTLPFDFDH